jgi:peptide/nickel transport system substrate-binding protein
VRAILSAGLRLALAALVIGLIGCSAAQSQSTQPQSGGTLRVRLSSDWSTLDPGQVSGPDAISVYGFIYDRLVDFDANGKLIPYLAKSWKETANSITFQIKPNVVCSDGAKLTPSAIAASYRRSLGTTTGKAQYGPGPITVSSDDVAGTFTMTSGAAYSDLVFAFAHPYASVMCPAAYAPGNNATMQPVGSGPYTLVSAVHGSEVVLKANPAWNWGPNGASSRSPGFPSTVIERVIADESTAANLLVTGGLNVAFITGPDVKRLLADTSLHHTVGHPEATNALGFNELPGHPGADPKVREALFTAIDPKAWNQAAYNGLGTLSSSYITPTTDCFDPGTAKLLPTYSLTKARQILESDGYSAGSGGKLQKDGRPLTVKLVATAAYTGKGGEYIASQWDQIGVTVNLQMVDPATWVTAFSSGNFDATNVNAGVNKGAPGAQLRFEVGAAPPAGTNLLRTNTPDVYSEYLAAEASVGAERCAHFAKAQQLMLTGFHILPLSARQYIWFLRGATIVADGYVRGETLRAAN